MEAIMEKDLQDEVVSLKDQAIAIKVSNVQSYVEAGELGKSLKELRAKVVAYFEKPKKKAADAHRELCNMEKAELKPIDEAITILHAEMNKYTAEQERIRKAAEDKLKAEQEETAAKERERLLNAAARADERGKTEKAEILLEKAENVYVAPVTVEPTVAKTVSTAAGNITQAKELQIQVVDIKAFLAEIVKRNMAPTMVEIKVSPLKAWVKANGLQSFPGLSIRETTGVRF